MRIIVLGAGLTGVATAYYLAEIGYEVIVIDRQTEKKIHNSFEHSVIEGIDQVSSWPCLSTPKEIFRWMCNEDIFLLFKYGLSFIKGCFLSEKRHYFQQIMALSQYSYQQQQALKQKLNLKSRSFDQGLLNIYTNPQDFEHALQCANMARQYGCGSDIKNVQECIDIEPALISCRDTILGGIYTPESKSGETHYLRQELESHARKLGVDFRYQCNVDKIITQGSRVRSIRITNECLQHETLVADKFVIALGAYSMSLLKPLGINLPLYSEKSCSMMLAISDEVPEKKGTLALNLMDKDLKISFTRANKYICVTGIDYNHKINRVCCEEMLSCAQKFFPEISDPLRDDLFFGVRRWTKQHSATLSNVPLIGGSRYSNLYLNTAHGTCAGAWACGAGKALSDFIYDNRSPEFQFDFVRGV